MDAEVGGFDSPRTVVVGRKREAMMTRWLRKEVIVEDEDEEPNLFMIVRNLQDKSHTGKLRILQNGSVKSTGMNLKRRRGDDVKDDTGGGTGEPWMSAEECWERYET